MTKYRKLAYIALLGNTLVWGAALPIVKLALPHTTPFRWLFFRFLFAAPLALPILIFMLYKYKPSLKTIGIIMAMELFPVLELGTLYSGLWHTSAIDASLIAATAPLFVIIGGILFLREKEEKREWLGFTLALTGMLIITLEPILANHANSSPATLLGNMLVIGRNLIWAIYLILAKRVYHQIPKLLITPIGFWMGMISFGLVSTWSTPLATILTDLATPQVLFAALYMAIFGSIVGLTLYLYGQNLIEASEATLFEYLQVVVAIPLSIWLLGDMLRLSTVIGLILIFTGVYMAEIYTRKS